MRFPIRAVDVKGVRYLRAEDVTAFLAEIAATEATDVRNRLHEAARSLRARTP